MGRSHSQPDQPVSLWEQDRSERLNHTLTEGYEVLNKDLLPRVRMPMTLVCGTWRIEEEAERKRQMGHP